MNRFSSLKPFAIGALILLGTLPACSTSPLTGPPTLKLGRDACAECGMLINEDRCSCSLLIERNGRREHLLYDDIGCMLDDERDGLDGAKVLERHVHDHASKHWVPAENAAFLFAEPSRIATPMGSGIVAFSAPQDAQAAATKHAGTIMDLPALAKRRKDWMHERYGRPDAGDK
jgi:hypothetical protein